MSEVEYLDIPYFLRAPGAVGEDVKREFKKLKKRIGELETAVNSSYDAKTVATANEIVKNGWRCCVDHIIKPESKCPVCRIGELEAGIKTIAPWLSASLTNHEHDGKGDYLTACNEIFNLDYEKE